MALRVRPLWRDRVHEGLLVSVRILATRVFWILLCGALPLLALYYAIAPNVLGDSQAADFHYAYYEAAEAIRAGENFYPPVDFVVRGQDDLVIDYVYPPLVALLTVPWTLVPVGLAEVLFQLLLIAVFVGTLGLLGVRDWRCYGLAFLWPPVTDAVATGNISILLGLAAAVVWVYRDRAKRRRRRARIQHRRQGVPVAADHLARRDPESARGRVERRRRRRDAARVVGDRRVSRSR